MDHTKLVRDKDKILSVLHENKNGSIVCSKEVKIYIPVRYKERNLAYVGSDNHILGIYAIVLDDTYYAVSNVIAMIQILPTTTNKVKIDGDEYFEFIFKAGSVVIQSTDLVKISKLTYLIFDEFFSKGYIPWYMGYEELGNVFDSADKHAGANVGSNKEVTYLITSLLARDKEDRTKYYRSTVTDANYLVTNPPTFVALKSVEYSATNTLNKMLGSYQSIGITSSLISPTTRKENIESILTA